MSSNKLASVPPAVCDLALLRTLELRSNAISALPARLQVRVCACVCACVFVWLCVCGVPVGARACVVRVFGCV